jgi:hypothetical protein
VKTDSSHFAFAAVCCRRPMRLGGGLGGDSRAATRPHEPILGKQIPQTFCLLAVCCRRPMRLGGGLGGDSRAAKEPRKKLLADAAARGTTLPPTEAPIRYSGWCSVLRWLRRRNRHVRRSNAALWCRVFLQIASPQCRRCEERLAVCTCLLLGVVASIRGGVSCASACRKCIHLVHNAPTAVAACSTACVST